MRYHGTFVLMFVSLAFLWGAAPDARAEGQLDMPLGEATGTSYGGNPINPDTGAPYVASPLGPPIEVGQPEVDPLDQPLSDQELAELEAEEAEIAAIEAGEYNDDWDWEDDPATENMTIEEILERAREEQAREAAEAEAEAEAEDGLDMDAPDDMTGDPELDELLREFDEMDRSFGDGVGVGGVNEPLGDPDTSGLGEFEEAEPEKAPY